MAVLGEWIDRGGGSARGKLAFMSKQPKASIEVRCVDRMNGDRFLVFQLGENSFTVPDAVLDDLVAQARKQANDKRIGRVPPFKRYLIFAWERHEGCGGWNDFMGSSDTLEGAEAVIGARMGECWQVLDMTTGQITKSSTDTDLFRDLGV